MAPPNSQAGLGGAPAPNSNASTVMYAGQTEADFRAEYGVDDRLPVRTLAGFAVTRLREL